METGNHSFWYKVVGLIIILSLIIPVLAACDDDDDEGDADTPATTAKITTPAKTTAPAATTAPAPADSDKPVKIGYILDWSGPAAMAGFLADGVIGFFEWYINEKQGGILNGRPLEIVRGDDKSQPAQGAAAAKKLITEQKVSAICGGGVVEPVSYAVADVTDPEKVAFFSIQCAVDLFEDYKWTVASQSVWDKRAAHNAEYIVNEIKPKTIAVLCDETQRAANDLIKGDIMALDPDIDIVFDETYIITTVDFSPYVTKIKYEKPDLVLISAQGGGYSTIAKQVTEQGGWGDSKVFCAYESAIRDDVLAASSAQGWYIMTAAYEGNPSFVAFRELWNEKLETDSSFGKRYKAAPFLNISMIANSVFAAIGAIELAGTDDPAKVAEAARGGKLELDSPLGHLVIGPDSGKNDFSGEVVQIQDGKLVLVDKPL